MKLSEVLKEQTSSAHRRAEEGLAFFKPEFKHQDYNALVQRLLALYQPLEIKLLKSLGHEPALELDVRLNKTHWLKSDLQQLNLAPGDQSMPLPDISNAHEALGALYVIEGSSLGGQLIAKNFTTRLGLAETQTQFFKGYGPQTGLMWQKFKTFLDSRDLNSMETEQVVQGALKAFDLIATSMRSPMS